MLEVSYFARMDHVRELIREKITEKGLDMAGLSRLIGRNHAYLQQFLERGSPRELPEGIREALGPLLGVAPDQLRSKPQALPRAPVPGNQPLAFARAMDKMPVLGAAEGGDNGYFLWNGEVVDYTPRPAFLSGAAQAYAIYVVGESMSPRYEPGELLYIHPGKPVTVGCYVLVQLAPKADGDAPRAFLKRLSKRSGNRILLEQFNPAKTFAVQSEDVVSIHRIVGSGEY